MVPACFLYSLKEDYIINAQPCKTHSGGRHPESYTLAFLTAQGSRLSRDAREIRRYLEAQL